MEWRFSRALFFLRKQSCYPPHPAASRDGAAGRTLTAHFRGGISASQRRRDRRRRFCRAPTRIGRSSIVQLISISAAADSARPGSPRLGSARLACPPTSVFERHRSLPAPRTCQPHIASPKTQASRQAFVALATRLGYPPRHKWKAADSSGRQPVGNYCLLVSGDASNVLAINIPAYPAVSY